MTNPKGARFERQIADFLAEVLSPYIDRRVRTYLDKGDLAGVKVGPYRVVVECKNTTRLELGAWVAEAEVEALNDHAIAGVVIHKRKGRGQPADQYVTMTVRDFVAILRAADV